ncbi:hypothetical protein BDW22DRAFT_1210392 [Trametopsis cervina]|nr:hypothetical protein BDW22DRAFT_1210392 [Trametopsis cervina]
MEGEGRDAGRSICGPGSDVGRRTTPGAPSLARSSAWELSPVPAIKFPSRSLHSHHPHASRPLALSLFSRTRNHTHNAFLRRRLCSPRPHGRRRDCCTPDVARRRDRRRRLEARRKATVNYCTFPAVACALFLSNRTVSFPSPGVAAGKESSFSREVCGR